MRKEKLEAKLEKLENLLAEIYTDQMVVKDYRITPTMYRKIKVMFKDIYWELDGIKEEGNV